MICAATVPVEEQYVAPLALAPARNASTGVMKKEAGGAVVPGVPEVASGRVTRVVVREAPEERCLLAPVVSSIRRPKKMR